MLVKSPCVGICRVEEGTCIGCSRTLDQIARWSSMDAKEAKEIAKKAREISIVRERERVYRLIEQACNDGRNMVTVDSLDPDLKDELQSKGYVVITGVIKWGVDTEAKCDIVW